MATELTPMMRQYLEMKEKNKDCLLFFRLGDFYEMFNEDAKLVSKELDLTLTTRDRSKDKEDQTPMCGVPYHSAEAYIARLVAKGYKVAICEQTEDPATAKGLVDRDIVRIVTPGTVTESSMLDESRNNYMASLFGLDGAYGLCFCDLSTGAFYATGAQGPEAVARVAAELGRFAPAEVIRGGQGRLRTLCSSDCAAVWTRERSPRLWRRLPDCWSATSGPAWRSWVWRGRRPWFWPAPSSCRPCRRPRRMT